MLISHRHHAPRLPAVRLELDRAIGEHLVLRRVRLEGLVHDERLFGATPPAGRSRLLVVLEGRILAFVGEKTVELLPGDTIAAQRVSELRTRSDSGLTLELDWDPGSVAGDELASFSEHGRLSPASILALSRLSSVLVDVATDQHAELLSSARVAIAALVSEGFPLALTDVEAALAIEDRADQGLFSAVDRALSALWQSPDTLDVVSELDWSRRTLTRRLSRMNERYRVHASGDWRSQRDFYRVLVGTLLLSHPDATTSGVAQSVGYRSAQALCHAFSNAGLPSPGSIRAQVRA